ncbi:DUF4302 domain-containing protein [Paraflavisolibacter sp. H34]|uniref:DUF4302 domain-containing protein n=1 Tax=Huijunlia imazamoxiresistens TaxID=3127457 RepID=UPI003019F642
MYKHILLYLLGLTVLLAGCQKKADDVFDKTPDERLADMLAAYQKTLTGAPYGWKLVIKPKGLEKQDIKVGGFSYYLTFTDANRVTMLSDFDTTMASVPKESGYRLKAVQRPSIYFDTYSYLHIPSDPTASISRTPTGANGEGWGSDFDFSFIDLQPSGDTLHLQGNFNESEAMLVKATQQEAAAYNNKQLANSLRMMVNLNSIGYFKTLTLGGVSYNLGIDEGNRQITFSWLGSNGTVQTYTTGYYYTLAGIALTEPFNTGRELVRAIDFNSFNAATQVMNVTVNNAANTVFDAKAPLKLDVNAARRWWQYSYDRDLYWYSVTAFTVNGVVDAYKMQSSVSRYYYLGYWAWYNTDVTGVEYGLLSPIKINAAGNGLTLNYGAAFNPPTFTTDGRIIFTLYGTLGTTPAAEQAAYINTVNKMLDANGYYLVQKGPLVYDMVSKDGKAWITWLWPQ